MRGAPGETVFSVHLSRPLGNAPYRIGPEAARLILQLAQAIVVAGIERTERGNRANVLTVGGKRISLRECNIAAVLSSGKAARPTRSARGQRDNERAEASEAQAITVSSVSVLRRPCPKSGKPIASR